MRVAYLINQYPKVSHSFIRREILALERQGFEVLRVALRGWDAAPIDDHDAVEQARTRYVLRGGIASLGMALLWALVTTPRLFLSALSLAGYMSRRADRPLPIHLVYLAEACLIANWMRTGDIAHLHAHFGTNPAEVAMLVHELTGLPWSFTVHGPEEFDKAEFIGLGEKIRRCSFVVAISSFGRSQLYRWVEHQHWSKIQVVHCGLDADYFGSTPAPSPAARRVICVGRLCEQKGQFLLVEAARRLASSYTDFELVLAGDGEMRQQLETRIEECGLRHLVRITGWLSGEQVKREIALSRVLVLPSFAEGLPVVLMEAMALGRPVISTYVAGIPELVRQDHDGWLVPAGDVDALVEALRECLNADEDTLQAMGFQARARAQERHSIEREVSKLASCIRSNLLEQDATAST